MSYILARREEDPMITIYLNKKILILHYFPFFFLPFSGGWIHDVLFSILVATFPVGYNIMLP